MARWLTRSRGMWLVLGVVLGIVAASVWPRTTLQAVATDRAENFAIATGSADGDVEGVFTLDFLTGDLTGAVLSPNTRNFSVLYKRNIMKDLNIEQGKQPKFVMTTGNCTLRAQGNNQWGGCLIYIAELSSGVMGVYGFPYNTALTNANRAAITGEFVLIQAGNIRTTAVRQ